MIGFIIQARTESTRYPNKIVLPFYQEDSIITLLLKKLKSNFDLPIILATSTKTSNDIIEKIAIENDVSCFRGSENDVLQRFIDAAEKFNLTYIIRICSDNPFIDVERIQLLLNFFNENQELDYISFLVKNTPSIKTHFGFWSEIVSLEALKRVKSLTNDGFYFEHVTNFIYTNPSSFKIEWIDEQKELNESIRTTVDTQEDFSIVSQLFEKSMEQKWNLDNLIDFLSAQDELLEKMYKQIHSNSK
ncbi:MAG: hypothetical protein RL264_2287 [Bacteroidota bacterium]|jgi:spore coat polysaccharide biosynthesis protein SpsF